MLKVGDQVIVKKETEYLFCKVIEIDDNKKSIILDDGSMFSIYFSYNKQGFCFTDFKSVLLEFNEKNKNDIKLINDFNSTKGIVLNMISCIEEGINNMDVSKENLSTLLETFTVLSKLDK